MKLLGDLCGVAPVEASFRSNFNQMYKKEPVEPKRKPYTDPQGFYKAMQVALREEGKDPALYGYP